MNFSNIFNINKRQFVSTMKREGITVIDYYDNNKSYNVFFRRNNRSTIPQGKVRFYYAQDTAISIGTIIVLKGIPYLVISQDGIESNVYYTSLAVKCDTTFNVYSNTEHRYVTVPCAVISDKYTLTNNSMISMVSGSVTVYTGDNSYARDMSINNGYHNFGGYYKVGNTFYNNGLAYVYMTREAMPTEDKYILSYNGVTSLAMADVTTYQLSYTAIKNDEIVDSPALTYASSNTSVATVDDTGLLTLLATGNVTITATWTDGNNTTCSTTIAISNSGTTEPITGTLTLSGRNDVRKGFNRTISATYSDANGNDVSSNYTSVWTITNATFDTSKLTQTVNGNQIILYFDDDNIVGGTFTLNVVDSDRTFTPATMSITLIDVL